MNSDPPATIKTLRRENTPTLVSAVLPDTIPAPAPNVDDAQLQEWIEGVDVELPDE